MTIVVDASVVAAALVVKTSDGRWAEEVLRDEDRAAPHLMPVEVASALRRSVLSRALSADAASLAHHQLQRMRTALFPYEPFAERAWELRSQVTSYDAWYVALAEALGADLVTLDRRLARAPGLRCGVRTPEVH